MLRLTAAVFLFIAIGCRQAVDNQVQGEPAQAVESTAVGTEPGPSLVSEDITTFRESLSQFLVEARAAAKFFTLAPAVESANSKAEQIADLYAHVPDVPDGIDDRESLAEKIKSINGSIAACGLMIRHRDRARRLENAEGLKLAAQIDIDLAKSTSDIRDRCDEIERLAGVENYRGICK